MRSGKKEIQGDLTVAQDTTMSGDLIQRDVTRNNDNIMLNAFRIAINGSLAQFNMVDGIVDEYEDESAVDTANSSNQLYDSTNDLYNPDTLGVNSDTKLMINGDFNDGSSGIPDDSGQGHVFPGITGGALDNSVKKFGRTSLNFNGTSDYLTGADSADWDVFGSNSDSWTVDFWVKHTDHAGSEVYVMQEEDNSNHWMIAHLDGTGLRVRVRSGGTYIVSLQAGEITDTNWHHVALCKVADEYGLYKDGTQVAYQQTSSTDTFSGSLHFGKYMPGPGDFYDGKMDEFRIQKSNAFSASPNVGTTDTITVPTAAHTADSNTKLLLHMDTVDESPSAHQVLFYGNSQIYEPKFGDGACYFNGSTAYLSVADHADWDIVGSNSDNWTIDFWVKHANHESTESYLNQWEGAGNTNYWKLFHSDGSGIRFLAYGPSGSILDTGYGGEITNSAWHHIAMCKVADEYAVYLDGIQVNYTQDSSTDTFAGSLLIGKAGDASQNFHGFMNEVRIQNSNAFSASPNSGKTDTITVPTTQHTSDSNTHLLLHLSADLTDSGNTGHTVTNSSTAIMDKKLGSGAVYFDGTGDWLAMPDSADWDIPAGDITIEGFVYFNSIGGGQLIFGQVVDGTHLWNLRYEGGFRYYMRDVTIIVDTGTVGTATIHTWHHVALIKVGNEYGIYLDGTQIGYVNDSSLQTFAAPLNIGAYGGSGDYFDGAMDELRIQKSNSFNAAPNSGKTDTITVPTSGYSSDKANMTLISDSFTAETQPDTARVILYEEDVDSVTLNTDLKAYVSRDGGTTWTQATLVDEGNYQTDRQVLAASVDISSQPSGTNMEYKIESLNNKDLKLHGTGLSWD